MNYTDEQERAIETIDKNLQIIACAGSGKTQVISERIVHTLNERRDQGITPASFVAFTFTEKAATELKDRIHRLCKEKLGTDEGLGDMYIGTIHGYCLNLLQEPPLYRFLKYRVLSDVQQRLFIDRKSNQSGLTRTPLLNGGNLKRWIDSGLYQQLLSIRAEAELDESQIPNHVDVCLNDYRQLIHENGLLDYSTILSEALTALRGHEELRNKISNQLSYLIVDEYQDINPLQENIIRELYDLSGNICVVGDDDQTIYQWRGSDVNNIITFTDRYPDVETVPLNINFRSSEAIVESSRQFIERLPSRLEKAMESADSQPTNRGDILALNFDNPEAEANWIAQKIGALYSTEYVDKPSSDPRGLTYSDMAILLRSVRHDARPIIQALEAENIPYIVSGMDGLFDTPEIQTMRNVFAYLSDLRPPGGSVINEEMLREQLIIGGLGLSDNQVEIAINFLNERKSRIGSQMDAELYIQRLYLDFLEVIELRELTIDRDTTNSRTGEMVYFNLGKFSNVISDFEQINFHTNPDSLYEQFSKFLYYQAPDYYPEGWEDTSVSNPDAVQIMTVHNAKGMQWPAVFVPCLRKNRFPSRRAGGRSVWHVIPDTAVSNSDRYKGTEEDERRLFYVATTRAERYLYCTWAPIQSNQQQRRRSPFHRDITDNEHILTAEPSTPLPSKISPSPRQENITLPLTFSELKYYFKCPYLFKLRFLYGFDAPINRALGYGKSLHDALAEIHSESINGRIPEVSDVDRLVNDHLHIPFANTAVKDNLENAAREALTNYLTQHGRNLDKLEHTERVVELKLEEGVVVNGRIDLIRRTDTNEILIVDFKSDDRAQEEDITQRQLQVYAVGYQQLTGTRADLIEIHNLDKGGTIRELIDDKLIDETLDIVTQAGRNLKENTLDRLPNWCDTCESCDLSSICRSKPLTSQ